MILMRWVIVRRARIEWECGAVGPLLFKGEGAAVRVGKVWRMGV
jgi:hypothetical protein